MGHSFQSFKNKQIRVHDSDIEVAMLIIKKMVIEDNNYDIDFVNTIIEWVNFAITAPPGCCAMNFDIPVIENNIDGLLALINKSIAFLKHIGPEIDKDMLHKIGGYQAKVFLDNYDSQCVIDTLEQLKELFV